jgi:hypothetical protein
MEWLQSVSAFVGTMLAHGKKRATAAGKDAGSAGTPVAIGKKRATPTLLEAPPDGIDCAYCKVRASELEARIAALEARRTGGDAAGWRALDSDIDTLD